MCETLTQSGSGLKNLIFITAADTCGPDDWNDYFNAISVTFVDATRSFTATQSPPGQGGIVNSFDFVWGDVGAQKIKRTVTKQDVSETTADAPVWQLAAVADTVLGCRCSIRTYSVDGRPILSHGKSIFTMMISLEQTKMRLGRMQPSSGNGRRARILR